MGRVVVALLLSISTLLALVVLTSQIVGNTDDSPSTVERGTTVEPGFVAAVCGRTESPSAIRQLTALAVTVLGLDDNFTKGSLPFLSVPDPFYADADDAQNLPGLAEAVQFRDTYGLSSSPAATADTLSTPEYTEAVPDWGVPLRPSEVQDLEYRQDYIEEAGRLIPRVGESNPSTFAGYTVDHEAGGKIIVGFTQDQAARIARLRSRFSAPDEIVGMSPVPKWTLNQLAAKAEAVADAAEGNGSLRKHLREVRIDTGANQVVVAATDLKLAGAVLADLLRSGGVVIKRAVKPPPPPSADCRFRRFDTSGPMQAGDYIESGFSSCTAAFGARARVFKTGRNGRRRPAWASFLLTAGHCVGHMRRVDRFGGWKLGLARKHSYRPAGKDNPTFDSAAIRVRAKAVPLGIFITSDRQRPITGTTEVAIGETVCHSGVTSGRVRCGPVLDQPIIIFVLGDDGVSIHANRDQIPIGVGVRQGDSGGPVWKQGTGLAVGIVSSAMRFAYGYGNCTYPNGPNQAYDCPIMGASKISVVESTLGLRVARRD